ncbi:MAG: tRNA-dihydrouridine synthase [Candidatus Saccharibacteria bacterium]|nr:tRNA-dihydrouridine synthase [Candidatus Saccharibacteria bacterium]
MNNFWQQLNKPLFILAPMEAVTDVVFRHVVASAAPPDVYFTEFTNATGWVNAGERAVAGRLDKTDETPIVAHLWGSDPDDIEKLAVHCAEMGYDAIDINTGCPDKSAIKSGGGAALIKNQPLMAEIIAAAKKSGLPVSVKARLGYSRVDEYKDWLKFLLSQDIVALTIHLRTKSEMSKVPAHYELLHDIVAIRDKVAPQTLIIANGDIENREHGLQIIKQYKVDGVMIGRGVFHNPFAFEKNLGIHTKEQLLELLHLHLNLYEERGDKKRKYETLKRFYKVYIRDFDGASELRHQLMQTKDVSEVREILAQHHL